MINCQLHIDITEYETKEDLIEIRFQNGDTLQVNFSKLFNRSSYFRDRYKYSEALSSIQNEIEKIKNELHISDECIKHFIELVQDEKIDISFEHYKDFYTLSEYLCIPRITKALDKIRDDELYQDLTFTIQVLLDSEGTDNNFEMKLMIKLENFLRERINECIENPKFGELPISTIYRLLSKSDKSVNSDSLFEFIFKSKETRFILIKFVSFDKLREEKLYEMIEFIEEQEEETKNKYLDYIPFNLSLIKKMINKYEQSLKEKEETKEKFEREKTKSDETKKELKKLQIINEKLFKENETYKNTKEEQDKEIEQLKQQITDLQTRNKKEKETLIQELTESKECLDKCKKELNETKDEINRIKSEKQQHTHDVFAAGYDGYNQLGRSPNNENEEIISPPLKFQLYPSPLLSYSFYYRHSVLITTDGLLKRIGYNFDGRITSSLEKTTIDHFTDFCMKDGSGGQLDPVSAVCYECGTLYMFSKKSGRGRQLVLCDCDINEGDPVFLDIGNHHPVSLFGGDSHSATICSEGEVIFINRDSVKKSPKSRIESVSLPDGEKASSVACCDDSIVVLSSNGRVFSSSVDSNGVLKFSEVFELKDKEIVCVSGTYEHILAVSKEGLVFGRGSNEYGRLGLGEGIETASSFTEISSLRGYEIRAAYAGYHHSLFETREGKILSCGSNDCGELLLNSDPGGIVYSPTETTITEGATFCIAGAFLSVVFIGNSPPPNSPNTRIQHYK